MLFFAMTETHDTRGTAGNARLPPVMVPGKSASSSSEGKRSREENTSVELTGLIFYNTAIIK